MFTDSTDNYFADLLVYNKELLRYLEGEPGGGAVGWGTVLQTENRGFDSRWCYWNF